MKNLIRGIFFQIIVKPLALLVLGVNVRNRERLPTSGPAIIIANHNSHLDTVILASLFPLNLLPYLRPVAAADYFLKNRFLAWYSRTFIGLVAIPRDKSKGDPLAEVSKAIEEKAILIFYPEGSRGLPEEMTKFKFGIANLAQRHADIPIYPIFLHGSGKALPKSEGILIPFFCDIFVGNPRKWSEWEGSAAEFIDALQEDIKRLPGDAFLAEWK